MNEKLPELRIIAKELYDRVHVLIGQMYDFVGNKMNVSKQEILNDYDHYLQCILLKVAMSDNNFDDEEVKFVKELVKDDLFKDYNFNDLDALLPKKEEIKNICHENINKIPYFVELSVYADKKIDEQLKVINPTYCQMIYDSLKRMLMYFDFVDGVVEDEEEVSSKNVLMPVAAYYKKKYVTYAPKRKED